MLYVWIGKNLKKLIVYIVHAYYEYKMKVILKI